MIQARIPLAIIDYEVLHRTQQSTTSRHIDDSIELTPPTVPFRAANDGHCECSQIKLRTSIGPGSVRRQPAEPGPEQPSGEHPEVARIRAFVSALEEWRRDLLAESNRIAAEVPDTLVPGTQAYADAWQALFDESLSFAYSVGAAWAQSYTVPREGLDPETVTQLDLLHGRLDLMLNWMPTAYNDLFGNLPRADVINIHIGPRKLPVPSKENPTTHVLREGDKFPGGSLNRQWLMDHGYVQAPVACAKLAGYTLWVHPGTGDQVMMFLPLGTPKQKGVCIE